MCVPSPSKLPAICTCTQIVGVSKHAYWPLLCRLKRAFPLLPLPYTRSSILCHALADRASPLWQASLLADIVCTGASSLCLLLSQVTGDLLGACWVPFGNDVWLAKQSAARLAASA